MYGMLLAPIWGAQDPPTGFQELPKWGQDASKMDSKRVINFNEIFYRFFRDFLIENWSKNWCFFIKCLMTSSTRSTRENHQKFASRLHEKQIFKVRHFLRKQQITEIITKKHVEKWCPILIDLGIDFRSILGAFWQHFWKIFRWFWATKIRWCLGRVQWPSRRQKNQFPERIPHIDTSTRQVIFGSLAPGGG